MALYIGLNKSGLVLNQLKGVHFGKASGRSTPRRSSSRSIKRKKFDDELVESSLKNSGKQMVMSEMDKEKLKKVCTLKMMLHKTIFNGDYYCKLHSPQMVAFVYLLSHFMCMTNHSSKLFCFIFLYCLYIRVGFKHFLASLTLINFLLG